MHLTVTLLERSKIWFQICKTTLRARWGAVAEIMQCAWAPAADGISDFMLPHSANLPSLLASLLRKSLTWQLRFQPSPIRPTLLSDGTISYGVSFIEWVAESGAFSSQWTHSLGGFDDLKERMWEIQVWFWVFTHFHSKIPPRWYVTRSSFVFSVFFIHLKNQVHRTSEKQKMFSYHTRGEVGLAKGYRKKGERCGHSLPRPFTAGAPFYTEGTPFSIVCYTPLHCAHPFIFLMLHPLYTVNRLNSILPPLVLQTETLPVSAQGFPTWCQLSTRKRAPAKCSLVKSRQYHSRVEKLLARHFRAY